MNDNFALDRSQWSTLRQLLDDALEQPPAQRATWVDQLDARYEDLKPRLRALLEHAARQTGALQIDALPKIETAQFVADRVRHAGEGEPKSGDPVGPYRLLRLIGEGGMGSVWLAERKDMLHRRQVALKLPRLVTGRAALAERLAREREILAALNHPNIARLYDAGIGDNSQPYLALEYVEGERIDAYCVRRHLDVPARLRLFQQVARAVAHAHANLVVHRDLKPTNILVTETGEVRLLDFGIAKLLEEDHARETELTQLAGRALTPDYASPEQILGRPISTASDIYSMGVVLYELLAGARPYKLMRASRAALEEAIVQADPAAPSNATTDRRLRRRLRGDLDTIVLKALRKQPGERYATVEALAEDIDRHLENRAVQAQPDSRVYRLRKFVARNAVGVSAGSAVLAAIVVGAGVSIWQARIAMQEQARAEEVKNFIASMFRDANPYATDGRRLSAVDLLKQSSERLSAINESRTELRVELMNLIGEALLALQDTEKAESILRQAALEASRALPANHPLLMETRSQMVTVHRFRGRTKEMKAELEQLLPLLRAQARSAPLALVNGLKDDAHLAIDEGRYAAAVTSSKEAVDLAMARLGPAHLQTAASWQVYGLSLLFNRQPREALEATRLAHEMTLKIRGGNEGHPQVINSRASHARALAANGRLEDAIRELKRAIADAGETLGQRARIVGFFSQNLVRYQLDAGEVKDAIASSERATSVLAEHVQEDSSTFGATLNARGIAYLAAYDGARAIADLDKSLATARKILGPRHEATLRSAAAHAAALAMDGQAAAALEAVRALAGDPTLAATPSGLGRLGLLAMAARLSGDDELTTELLDRVTGEIRFEAEHRRSEVRWRIETGLHQVATGRPAEAERNFRSALADGVGHALAHSPETSEAQVGLARSLMYQGRAAEALPLLRQSDAFWRGFDSENRWAGEAAFWLAKCYAALGRDADAMQAYQRAVPILARSRLPGDAHLVKLARAR